MDLPHAAGAAEDDSRHESSRITSNQRRVDFGPAARSISASRILFVSLSDSAPAFFIASASLAPWAMYSDSRWPSGDCAPIRAHLTNRKKAAQGGVASGSCCVRISTL